MDDRRFDALTKALAKGSNRRSVLKGLLGLGGAALTGEVLRQGAAEAARRPTPAPTPVKCPGHQFPCDDGCCCPDGETGCGPACCQDIKFSPPDHRYSECCDNQCCFGACYGEELCCPTNLRGGNENPQPPSHRICETVDGAVCCPYDRVCCLVDGCCDTICSGGAGGADFCCPADDICAGGSSSDDLCCEGDTVCCGAGANGNVCADLSDDDDNCGACGNVCGGCSSCQNGVCLPEDDLCLACETCQLDAQTNSYVCVNDCTGCAECQASELNPAGNCFPLDSECLSCQVCELNDTGNGGACENDCPGDCGNCVRNPETGAGVCVADSSQCPVTVPAQVCCPGGGTFTCEEGPYCGCDDDGDCPACNRCNLGTCEPICTDSQECCAYLGTHGLCVSNMEGVGCCTSAECTNTGLDDCLVGTCSAAGVCSYAPDNTLCGPDCGVCISETGVCSDNQEACGACETCIDGACDDDCETGEQCCPGTIHCVPATAICCTADAQCSGDCEYCDEEAGYCKPLCTLEAPDCCSGTTDFCVDKANGGCCDTDDCGACHQCNANTHLCEAIQDCCDPVCTGCATCDGGVCVPGQCFIDCKACNIQANGTQGICEDICTGCTECRIESGVYACRPKSGNPCLSCQTCTPYPDGTGGDCVSTCQGCGICESDSATGDGRCVPDNTQCDPRICCGDGSGGFACEDGPSCGCDDNDDCSNCEICNQQTHVCEVDTNCCDPVCTGPCEDCVNGACIGCADGETCCDNNYCIPGDRICCQGQQACDAINTCGDDLKTWHSFECSFSLGYCVANEPVACNDGNPCTLDFCARDTGCSHLPHTGEPCDDCLVCSDQGTCDIPVTPGTDCGACLQCDDQGNCDVSLGSVCGDLCCSGGDHCCFGSYCAPQFTTCCTSDNDCIANYCEGLIWHEIGCDTDLGYCVTPRTIDCNDGDLCTTDSCSVDGCLHTPRVCIDNPCRANLGCRVYEGSAACYYGTAECGKDCGTDQKCDLDGNCVLGNPSCAYS